MKRILLIEDDLDHREMIEHVLRALSAQITWACDGDQALQLLFSETFDLIVSDLQLGGTSGIQIAEKLRESPGPNQTVPLLILTAGGSEFDEAALLAGATAVMTKKSLAEIKRTASQLLQS